MSDVLPNNTVENEAWKVLLKFIILCVTVSFFCEQSAESLVVEFSTKPAWLIPLLHTDTRDLRTA